MANEFAQIVTVEMMFVTKILHEIIEQAGLVPHLLSQAGGLEDHVGGEHQHQAEHRRMDAGLVAETIKTELKARKLRTLTLDGIDIALASVAGRSSFDRKGAEKKHGKLDAFYSTGNPSERLTVERKGDAK